MWSSQKRFYASFPSFLFLDGLKHSCGIHFNVLLSSDGTMSMKFFLKLIQSIPFFCYYIPARCGVLHQARETEINSLCKTVSVRRCSVIQNRGTDTGAIHIQALEEEMVGDIEEVIEWHHIKTCNCFVMFLPWYKKKIINNVCIFFFKLVGCKVFGFFLWKCKLHKYIF